MKSRFLLLFLVIVLAVAPLSGVTALFAQDAEGCEPGEVAEDAPLIRFGAAVSQSGSLAVEGQDTLNGYNVWLDWVNNENGGINVGGECHRAEIVVYDDESDADTVSLLTERLILEDEVDFILGPYSSGLTQVASQITEREGVIMVEGNGASETLFERGFENLFGVLTPASLYTKSGIEEAHARGARSAVVFYDDAAFATSVAEGARQWLEDLDIEILAFEGYPRGLTDVSAEFTRFRDLDPDIFIGGGHRNEAALFLSTAKEVDFNPDAFIITVGPSSPQFVADLEDDSFYVWGPVQWARTMAWEDPWFGSAEDYALRYEDTFDIAPSYQAAESTAAALVLHQAIESAASLDTDDVRTALQEMDIVTFYGPIRFDETGKNVAKPMATIQVQPDGAIEVIAPAEVAAVETIWPAPGWSQR